MRLVSLSVVVLTAALTLPIALFAQSLPGFGNRAPTGEFPKTDFNKLSIDPAEIMSGGPPRDGIPAIDAPVFETFKQASGWLKPNEPVVSLRYEGVARAYPLQILIYHEIVNDMINDKPVTVTFCPLCNASIVFDGTVDGQALNFGTTGRLRKSDLVMYDRQTESWWQQFTGTGIVGEFTGTQLKQLPSQIVSFEVFQQEYPEGEVLSKNTGALRPYGNNPYRGYDNIDSTPFLFQDPLDPRLPPMERVLAIAEDGGDANFQLVPLTVLESNPLIQLGNVVVIATSSASSALDESQIAESRLVPSAAAFESTLDGESITLSVQDDGTLVDEESGSEWSALGKALSGPRKGAQLAQVDRGVHFAFAWLAFDPEANIVKAAK